MKQLLVACLLLVSLSSLAQSGRAVKIFPFGNYIAMQDSGSATPPALVPYGQLGFFPVGKSVEVRINGSGELFAPAKILNVSGVAYGTTVPTSLTALKTILTTSGGGGGGSGSSPATFGTVPDAVSSYTTASGNIDLSTALEVTVFNAGTASITVTYGLQSFTLPALGSARYYRTLDQTTNSYSSLATLSLNATGSQALVTRKFKQ